MALKIEHVGEVEIDSSKELMIIESNIITYGNAADEQLTESIRDEIESMWNEPRGKIKIGRKFYEVIFRITASLQRDIDMNEVYGNLDPRNNYFRIEEYAHGNISFVDGLGCNSGYFKLENLYKGSTTAAHEYGHTLGLEHPSRLDYRGMGIPGIMYPRGTLVDPQFQYDPAKAAGEKGGTLYPIFRKVLPADISLLKLERLRFNNAKAVLGDFTNVFHFDHADEGLA